MMELAATIVVKCLDGQAAAPSKQLGSLVDLGMQANERQQGEAGTGKRGLTRDDNCRHLNLSRARFFFFFTTPPSIFPDPTSTRSHTTFSFAWPRPFPTHPTLARLAELKKVVGGSNATAGAGAAALGGGGGAGGVQGDGGGNGPESARKKPKGIDFEEATSLGLTETPALQLVHTSQQRAAVRALCFSPDGSLLASGNEKKKGFYPCK